MEPHHSLFREKAIKEYMQRREKDVLPRMMAPSILIFLYLLLLLLLLAGLLVWWEVVPVFTTGSLLAATSTPHLTAGDLVNAQVQGNSSGPLVFDMTSQHLRCFARVF